MDTYGYFCMFIPCITIQCVPYLASDLIFGHAKCSTCRLPGQSDHTPSDMQNLLSLLSLPWTGGMLWLPARFLCDPYMGTISVGICRDNFKSTFSPILSLIVPVPLQPYRLNRLNLEHFDSRSIPVILVAVEVA